MPQSLRKKVVNLAHEGHQGVVKSKERLRTKVWWSDMDREAEIKGGVQSVTSLSQRMFQPRH